MIKTKVKQHIVFLFLMSSVMVFAQTSVHPAAVYWQLSKLLQSPDSDLSVKGNPKLVSSPYGDAVYFNGINDALFLENMPLKAMEAFTIEMRFKPEKHSAFEQRIVHLGEISGDRMLLEIRVESDKWYFDGFVKSGNQKLALIDETKLHPIGAWYHVAFVVSPNSLTTYVNGNKELIENFTFHPIKSGKSAIGVRLNERSWFQGSIYDIKITPKILTEKDFKLPKQIN